MHAQQATPFEGDNGNCLANLEFKVVGKDSLAVYEECTWQPLCRGHMTGSGRPSPSQTWAREFGKRIQVCVCVCACARVCVYSSSYALLSSDYKTMPLYCFPLLKQTTRDYFLLADDTHQNPDVLHKRFFR